MFQERERRHRNREKSEQRSFSLLDGVVARELYCCSYEATDMEVLLRSLPREFVVAPTLDSSRSPQSYLQCLKLWLPVLPRAGVCHCPSPNRNCSVKSSSQATIGFFLFLTRHGSQLQVLIFRHFLLTSS